LGHRSASIWRHRDATSQIVAFLVTQPARCRCELLHMEFFRVKELPWCDFGALGPAISKDFFNTIDPNRTSACGLAMTISCSENAAEEPGFSQRQPVDQEEPKRIWQHCPGALARAWSPCLMETRSELVNRSGVWERTSEHDCRRLVAGFAELTNLRRVRLRMRTCRIGGCKYKRGWRPHEGSLLAYRHE
jgi:hypothetical protein